MKTANDIRETLDQYFQANYYAEDYEVQWKVKNLRDDLSEAERNLFDEVIVQRLTDDPSVLNITICTKLEIPALIPVLTGLLDQEEGSSQRSRTIMYALQHYVDDAAYDAIERFMDSEQEREALHLLCRVNFDRSRHHLLRAIFRRGWEGECIHILHEQRKKVGLNQLIQKLQNWGASKPSRLRRRLRHVLKAKSGDYNPFDESEVHVILSAFPRFL